MSPIKNLSENVRLPRLGHIHLGTRDPERGFPRKSEFFVFPPDHSDYKQLVELFGETPKELRILIPVEDEEQWATQYYKSYNQTYGLVCKGDGEMALRMVDIKTGELPVKENAGTVELRELPCAGKDCPIYRNKGKGKPRCHEVMNLKFLLPEIPGLGVWQIDTGSINSILNINSCAKIIKRAFGRISLIPLKLTFEPVAVNNPEDGKKQTVYVLNLRTDVTMAQLADAAREQAKTFLLESPDLEAVFDAGVEKDIDALFGEKKPELPPSAVTPQEKAPDASQVKQGAVERVEGGTNPLVSLERVEGGTNPLSVSGKPPDLDTLAIDTSASLNIDRDLLIGLVMNRLKIRGNRAANSALDWIKNVAKIPQERIDKEPNVVSQELIKRYDW